MKKVIKKYGNSLIISFTPEEKKIYRLEERDILDIEIKKVEKNGKKSVYS